MPERTGPTAYAGFMVRWWGFGPFVVVSILHLVSLSAQWQAVALPTKFLLMPTLLLALLVSLPSRRSEIALWGGLALVLAWAGDVLLADPGELGFLVGLGSFLLAHVAYVVLYVRPLRTRRPPWWAFAFFAAWWAALIVLLLPHVGALAIPVTIYGFVLCAAAAMAMGTTPLVAVGAFLFLVSDTILGFRFFLPGFSLWQADSVIMLGYIAGQGLIIAGAVRHARSRLAPRAELA